MIGIKVNTDEAARKGIATEIFISCMFQFGILSQKNGIKFNNRTVIVHFSVAIDLKSFGIIERRAEKNSIYAVVIYPNGVLYSEK